MKWTVIWTPAAEQDLADLWTNAPDRTAIAAAADSIDAAKEHDPQSLGESRGSITRIAFETPLAVLFDVDVARRSVRVWDVWRWPP